MMGILVLKAHLMLYQPRGEALYETDRLRLEMAYSLLFRLQDHPRWRLKQVADIMHSPWPACLPIFPLNMNPLQFDHDLDLWNEYPNNFTMIKIDYAEIHKEIGLQCIWILQTMSSIPDVIFYAQDHWINHILNAYPSEETLQTLLDNVASLNEEDARRALEWAEVCCLLGVISFTYLNIEYQGVEESQDKLAQQLIMRIRRHLKPRGRKRWVSVLLGSKVKHRWMEKLKLCCF
ncbi:hypothetical protein BT96DRAFT_80605 [Gymnopus androsaceus JB14]|uniref:Uncharacterized protein n=1 Tax=Gymnopus androsaceus JB14 TaxID=1447944 RepID=A0A6A4GD17_9AGAR|nr:hypothetical protein BT96DRAFT_80605 [Gymnopus androsaceus JB14]